MNFKRILCFLLSVCILPFALHIPLSATEDDNTKIYLESKLISDDTVKVSLCVRENKGFCGGLFALSYNEKYLSYAFCLEGDIRSGMRLTPSLADVGKIYILLDSTKNFSLDGSLAHFYFRIKDEGADVLKFEIGGVDNVSLVRIDGGEVTPVGCSFLGDSLILRELPRVVGFQYGNDGIRIICVGNREYGILGMTVRAVYPEKNKIEEYIFYSHAYESLLGSQRLPIDFLAKYFFVSQYKIGIDTACLFVTPFGYDGDKIIFGKEKTLLFYKGEYI